MRINGIEMSPILFESLSVHSMRTFVHVPDIGF